MIRYTLREEKSRIDRMHYQETVRRTEWLTLALAYAGFIGLGLVNSRLNVAWPAIRATFGMPLDALGVLLIGNTIGYMIASAGSGRLGARLNLGVVLALGCGAAGMGLIGTGAAPSWIVLVALSVLIGMGAGAIDASLNAHAAAHFSPRVTNWLHACFGVGATLGPAIMTVAVAGSLGWRAGFLVLGAIQLALAVCYGLTPTHWQGATTRATPLQDRGATLASTLRLPTTWLGILLFFACTGVQVSAGQWLYSLLTEARGVPAALAGAWASIYWGSTAVGRVLIGFVVQRVPPTTVLRWSMVGAVLSTLLLWANIGPWPTFGAIALLGLTLAPQYPLLISATPRYLGARHAANGVGLQVAASGPGAVLVAGLIGVLAQARGLEVIGPALFVMAAIMTALFELLARRMGDDARAAQG
jgi:fucose permease